MSYLADSAHFMSNQDQITADFVSDEQFAEKFFAGGSNTLKVDFGAATHQGYVRPNNEDHYAVVKRRRTSEAILTNLSQDDLVLTDDATYALVVADGMGGANFGELASRLALRKLFELAQQATSWVSKYTDLNHQQIPERVDAYVQEIQSTLRARIDADPALAGMGTTWTSAHLLLPHVLVVHIGDSRAYLLRNGELLQITRDDTLAQACIDSGMDPNRVSKLRHLLLNSFGGETDDVTARIHQFEIEPGDQLLLCTDGLTDMVADQEIATILHQSLTPQAACDKLISAALENGGKDNVTVIVAAAANVAT